MGTTVNHKANGSTIRQDSEGDIDRIAALKAVAEKANEEIRTLEKGLAEDRVDEFANKLMAYAERECGVIIVHDEVNNQRFKTLAKQLLSHGPRHRQSGPSKSQAEQAETIIDSIRGAK